MRYKRVIAVLLCLLLGTGCVGVSEENSYHSLCEQEGLISPEVIAWLEIPGYPLCEPIMQHPSDDTYYANHSAKGDEDANGTLYVQAKYNAANFSDPVTLIYGSNASSGAVFGDLQEVFSGSFESCRSVFIHTPDSTQEYVVFAALPYSSIHILHYYDFEVERRYSNFFDSVFSTRVLGMHLDKDNRPVAGIDQVIIFSTRLRGDPLQRYLVMARRIDE